MPKSNWHPSRVSNWAKQRIARDVNLENDKKKKKIKKLKPIKILNKNGDWTING